MWLFFYCYCCGLFIWEHNGHSVINPSTQTFFFFCETNCESETSFSHTSGGRLWIFCFLSALSSSSEAVCVHTNMALPALSRSADSNHPAWTRLQLYTCAFWCPGPDPHSAISCSVTAKHWSINSIKATDTTHDVWRPIHARKRQQK